MSGITGRFFHKEFIYSCSFRSSTFCPLFRGALCLGCPLIGGFTVQWNLYKADTIGAKKNVRFIEIFSK